MTLRARHHSLVDADCPDLATWYIYNAYAGTQALRVWFLVHLPSVLWIAQRATLYRAAEALALRDGLP